MPQIVQYGYQPGRKFRLGWRTSVLILVGLLIGGTYGLAVLFGWDEVGCKKIDIDALSGDLRQRRFVLFIPVSESISVTEFSKLAHARGYNSPSRQWQPVELRSIATGTFANFRYSPAVPVCNQAAWLLSQPSVTSEQQSGLLKQYMILLQRGDAESLRSKIERDADNVLPASDLAK